jgi:glucose-6-phosphate isomerase
MIDIDFNEDNAKNFILDREIDSMQESVDHLHSDLENKTGQGSDSLGWLHLPSLTLPSLFDSIYSTQKEINEQCNTFVCIGIGGSYLGTRAAISFLKPFSNEKNTPEILFAGNTFCSDYHAELLQSLEDREVCINLVSKSGTTLESSIAFRLLRSFMEKKYGKEGARRRIFVTTGSQKSLINDLAKAEGYRCFYIPDDVGGRFSVLTSAGLLPISVAGIDIRALMDGALLAEKELTRSSDLALNKAYLYAVYRHLFFQKGKYIELMAAFNTSFEYFLEWWKQLAGESEGKKGKGIFPASVNYTTDLHSLGQLIQEGTRNLFETFLLIDKPSKLIEIERSNSNEDGLGYLEGKTLDFINEKAYKGSASAHLEGGVPNLAITLKERSPHNLGQLFYFFERSISMSGYLSGVNPFDQPGVELYKRNMFGLLNKPNLKKGK